LKTVFGDESATAAQRFWYGKVQLDDDEIDPLKIELDARRDDLGEAHLTGVDKHVAAAKRANGFAQKPKDICWSQICGNSPRTQGGRVRQNSQNARDDLSQPR